MSEVKHTPGPWHVERDDHFGPGFVIVSPAAGMHNRAPVVRLSSPLMETDETLEADAYLIAAAPEMLAALKEALDVLSSRYQNLSNGHWEDGELQLLAQQIGSALSKAGSLS